MVYGATVNFPYKKVLDYLKNKISDNDLSELYYQYNIDDSSNGIEQLADIISDQDLLKLGYVDDTEEKISESVEDEYKYPNVEDIVVFLSSLDEDNVDQLYTKYCCNTPEDLSLALTDDELETLGYGIESDDDEELKYNEDDIGYSDQDYNEELDYLEDIPVTIKYLIVDPEEGIFAVDSEQDFYQFTENLDSTLVENCELYSDCIDTNKVLFKVIPKKFEISEEVIVNKELNPVIFNEDHNMIPEIKEQIIDYVNNLITTLSDKNIVVDYNDIVLIGSNAGYLYTPDSDIDIHLISTQQLSPETADRLFDEFDIYEAENPLIIGDYSVELGIEDGYDVSANSARRYSLVDDTWIDESDNNEQYTEADLSSVAGYEDIVNEYTDKINEVVDNDEFAQASALKSEIRQNRSDDLANVGALSMGNVVFKELRNNGAYGKLRDYIKARELEVGLGNDE